LEFIARNSLSQEESRGNAAACVSRVRTHGGKIWRNARATRRKIESDSRTGDMRNISDFITSVFFRGKNGYCWSRVSVRSRFLSGVNAVFDYSPWLADYADAKTEKHR